mmetsp:Transcript_14876/g.22514  ORF Transcript_14876/g.22514 Transcript_14876/m.22514 type:complete len:472 (+) Transcript_14876:37-1452(+)
MAESIGTLSASTSQTAKPKLGSDEDLANLAASYGVTKPKKEAKTTDADLAALAAQFSGLPTATPPAATSSIKRNSDADLAQLAASVGATPLRSTDKKEEKKIAKSLQGSDPENAPGEDQDEDEGFEEEEDGKEGKDDNRWVQYLDEESGCPYWYNTGTGETTWEEPLEEFDVDESAAHILDETPTTTPKDGMGKLDSHPSNRNCDSTLLARGPQTPAPKPNGTRATADSRAMSMTDRIFGYFSTAPARTESGDVSEMLKDAGPEEGESVTLTTKQLKKLIGMHKRHKAIKLKLKQQTETYNKNIKTLVERDRKYKIMIRKQEETHLKDLHVLKAQNARLAKGISEQHDEFKRKNFKVLKQNQSMGKQLNAALLSLQDKKKLESDHKSMKEENMKLRQYIKHLQREVAKYKKEVSEQKTIVTALKDATKAAHIKIVELEKKSNMNSGESMPVADIKGTDDDDRDGDPQFGSV